MNESSELQTKSKLVLIAVSTFVIAGTMAALNVAVNNGAGINDVPAFLFWSVFFSACLVCVFILMRRICRLGTDFNSYVIAILVGSIAGVFWTVIVQFTLGSWFRSFGFPVIICWIVGGIGGMISSLGRYESPNYVRELFHVLLIVSIGVLAILGTKPLSGLLSDDRRIHVICIRWTQGLEPLSTSDINKLKDYGLTNEGLNGLIASEIRGELDPVSG